MKKFIAFLLLALFTLMMGLMFTGCGSRKTATSKTEEKTSQKDTLTTDTTVNSSSLTTNENKQETTELEKQKEISAEVKQGETLQVDQFDANGKLIGSTVFKGSGKATVKDVEKSKLTDQSSKSETVKKTDSKKKTQASSQIEKQVTQKSKETERKESIQGYISLAFVASLIFLLWRHRKKEEQ
jgi:hypothetical protein